MEYTPGPWEVIEGQGCAKVKQIVPTPCVPALRAIIYGNNWRADANLIKVAPEMLGALDRVIERVNYLGRLDHITDEGLLEDIEQIISEARGNYERLLL